MTCWSCAGSPDTATSIRNVLDDEVDTGRQRGAQKRGCLLEQSAHLHRADTRVGPPPECEDIVDQVAATLRRTAYLVNMLCRFGSAARVAVQSFPNSQEWRR